MQLMWLKWIEKCIALQSVEASNIPTVAAPHMHSPWVYIIHLCHVLLQLFRVFDVSFTPFLTAQASRPNTSVAQPTQCSTSISRMIVCLGCFTWLKCWTLSGGFHRTWVRKLILSTLHPGHWSTFVIWNLTLISSFSTSSTYVPL